MNGTDLISRWRLDAEYIAYTYEQHKKGIPMSVPDPIRELIRNQPAVDAVEVRHGRWIHVATYEMHGEYGGLVGEAYCSECELYSTQLSADGRVGYDYCPRCGARMDLKGS